jgi:cation diffusion facilitator CzcD-associated flavoprotein CzcO
MMQMAGTVDGGLPEHVDVAVVGAGFGGLGMAIKLKQAGRDDFLVIERADEVGGTWEANTYPGCQCDVPSNVYSFSFALNPSWSSTFPTQPEIWDYLRGTADRFGVRAHLRLGCEMRAATWVEEARLWRVETSRGDFTARVLISAVGGLSEPAIPEIPGIEHFGGASFHTARWDHDHDLRGRRVAVLGTGASAIQVIPKIQPQVARLTVFQRTPPWIFPHNGRKVGRREQRLFRLLPAAQRAVRGIVFAGRESLYLPMRSLRVRKLLARLAQHHIRRQVQDEELRRKLTPDYEVGCKRMLISNDFYPALQQPNVELVTEAVRELRPHGIVTADGREHEVDTIVWATGFRTGRMPVGERIRGRGGQLLADLWRQNGMEALRGSAVAGFPNLFMLTGPNTALGHGSGVFIIESQLTYVLDALRAMESRGADLIEPRKEAQDAFNEELQEGTKGKVWVAGGCTSWYLDERGRNTMLWPRTCWSFRRATRQVDPAEYVFES